MPFPGMFHDFVVSKINSYILPYRYNIVKFLKICKKTLFKKIVLMNFETFPCRENLLCDACLVYTDKAKH